MYHNLVTLSLEQQWSDEVRYLHSLWRQGPPHSNPNPKPQPQLLNPAAINPNLAPSNPTSFKKKKKKKKKINQVSDSDPVLDPSLVSTKDWAWQPSPVREAKTGWPEPVAEPKSLSSVEDKVKLAALQLQRSYFKACHDFFSRNREDSDDDVVDYDSMDEDEDEDEEKEGSEEFDFFFGIFKEDQELRNYYKKKYEGGEFYCLVCGGTGQKVGKRFKDCVALVQHSTAISKTKSKSAHRAFGQVVCRVLGWDIKRLPNIVLSLEDPLGGPLENNENVNVDGANTEADNVGIGLNETNNKVVEEGEQVDGAAEVSVHGTDEGPFDVGIGLNETNNKVVEEGEQVDGAAEVSVHGTDEGPFDVGIGLNETNNKVVEEGEQVDGAAEVSVHGTDEGPFNIGIGLNETNNKVVVKKEQVDGAVEVLVHGTDEGPFDFEIDYSLDPNEEGAGELYEDL